MNLTESEDFSEFTPSLNSFLAYGLFISRNCAFTCLLALKVVLDAFPTAQNAENDIGMIPNLILAKRDYFYKPYVLKIIIAVLFLDSAISFVLSEAKICWDFT